MCISILIMSQKTRRILQAILYETIAIAVIGPALGLMFKESLTSTATLSIIMSAIALVWNYLFNTWFEHWEARQPTKLRTLRRRLMHGFCFEGGLVVVLVPFMALWLNTSLLRAFIADLGILLFFFVYTLAFTWSFDHIFDESQSTNTKEF